MMLYQRLKKFREASGLTQQQVADVLNLDRSTYAYYETGKTTPDIKSVSKLIKIFNISYYDLIDEDDPRLVVNDSANDEEDDSEKMHIYELSKAEKQLVINFRVLSASQKEDLLYALSASAFDKNKKIRKNTAGSVTVEDNN